MTANLRRNNTKFTNFWQRRKASDLIVVAERDAPQHLEYMCPGGLFRQPALRPLQLVQDGVVDVLEHEVQATLAPEELDQVYQVFVSETLQSVFNKLSHLISCRWK